MASPHHLATQAGLAILRAGGTAVDAAIAVNAALAVVAGHSCGLGGDAFWLIWDARAGEALALNGSGRSGRGASIEAARAAGYDTMPERGPWSITVPGAIHSWGTAHDRFGRLAWATLLESAIDLAAAFPASPGWIDAVERAASVFGEESDWARVYRPPERPRGPAASCACRRCRGRWRSWRGRVPELPIAVTSRGGQPATSRHEEYPSMPRTSLSTRSDWGTPLSIGYRGVTALSHPPNSVGVVALQTLGMLERFDPPAPGPLRWPRLGRRRVGAPRTGGFPTGAR